MQVAARTVGFGTGFRVLLMLLLFIAVFAGLQGGRYYFANRLQELGIASSLGLYVIGGWFGLFQLTTAEWRRWVIMPLLLVGGIMSVSACVFALNYEGNVLHSFFSAREFLLAFTGPGVYLLSRCGWQTGDVRATLWFALIALLVNYLVFYNTMDLRATFFSSDHTVSNLVTYDEWRGFRLKPPLFAIMVALLASLSLLAQRSSPHVYIGALLMVAVAAYIWSIVMFRSALATMVMSMAIYPIFLSNYRGVHFGVVLLPVLLLVAPVAGYLAAEYFLSADGGFTRAKAFAAALEHIPTHFLLGAGEDSAYGETYQDIVAPYFFPSDLGLVGTTYKYGILGACLYLLMHGLIWHRLWQANLSHRLATGRRDPLTWALLIFMTAQTFNLALNPGLTYAQGITLGSVALALAGLQLKNPSLSPNLLSA